MPRWTSSPGRDSTDTTVEEIADACDVSPRTFFRYFATKEDVLFGDGDEHRRELVEALDARPAGEPPLRSMRAGILGLASHYEHDRARLVAKNEIMTRNPTLRSRGVERQHDWEAAVTETLRRRAQAAGTVDSMLELRLVAGVATAAAPRRERHVGRRGRRPPVARGRRVRPPLLRPRRRRPHRLTPHPSFWSSPARHMAAHPDQNGGVAVRRASPRARRRRGR